jgi:hypothetical protein
MTARKRPARRCGWHDCTQPVAATVARVLPNLLAGSRRDYCATHTTQVRTAKGTLVAHFGRRQPALAGQPDDLPEHRGRRTHRKGVRP